MLLSWLKILKNLRIKNLFYKINYIKWKKKLLKLKNNLNHIKIIINKLY